MSVLATQERLSLGSWSPPYLRPVLHIVARMLVALSAAVFAAWARTSGSTHRS